MTIQSPAKALLFLTGLGLAACDDHGATQSSAHQPSASSSSRPAPQAPQAKESVVSVVSDRVSVPLSGERVEAVAGDWMIRGGGMVAIVSAQFGRIIDFAPENQIDGLGYVDSLVWNGLDDLHDEVVSIEALGGVAQVVHVQKRVPDRGLTLHLWYWLDERLLRIDSLMVNDGRKRVVGVTLGEIFRWGNTPTWVEGHGSIDRGGAFGGDFIARENQGISYAASSLDGRLMARFGSPDLPGFHPSAKTGESPIELAPGQISARRRIAMAYSSTSMGEAAMRLPPADSKPRKTISIPGGAPLQSELEIARCEPPPESFSKLLLPSDHPPAAAIEPKKKANTHERPPLDHAPFVRFLGTEKQAIVPDGCLVARFVAPGFAPGAWASLGALASADKSIMPKSGTLSWEVTEKNAPVPIKLSVRGIDDTADPDWGDEGIDGRSDQAIYSATGKGSAPIPPGRYHVLAGRGSEYTLHEEDITVEEGKAVTVKAAIERADDTSGWISADLHVHAIPSFDAPVRLTDRALSLAGAGVEAFAATDHNRITDYTKAIAEAGLTGRLASVIGDEVTSQGVEFGHFNAFPLRGDATPPPALDLPPKEMFDAMRAAAKPGSVEVLQVNHPRMGDIGYFDLLRLDSENIEGSIRRSPLFDEDFDALEVFNGDHYADIPKVERAMVDWYALLASGKHVTATGNSDSHKVTFQEAGVPRNWVRVPDDDPAHFNEKAFIDAIRQGEVVVSNGPFITMTVNQTAIGGHVKSGDVNVTIHVEAPSWIDVTRIELINKGHLVKVFEGSFKGSGKRFDQTFTQHVERGDFLVAIVRGEEPMHWLLREKAKPFGFTNPIWVD